MKCEFRRSLFFVTLNYIEKEIKEKREEQEKAS